VSRERLFEWLLLGFCLAGGVLVGRETAPHVVRTTPVARTEVTAPAPGPQTQDLAPIFRCSGAGGQVLVSLGGDGKSVYVWCPQVKS